MNDYRKQSPEIKTTISHDDKTVTVYLYHGEQIKCVPEFPNYHITSEGRVWSWDANRFLNPSKCYVESKKEGWNKCYLKYYLVDKNGKTQQIYAQRLVWMVYGDTWMFFKYFVKAWVAIYLVSNTFTITMAVFDVGQSVVNSASGIINGETAIDVSSLSMQMQAAMATMEIGELVVLALETFLVSFCMKIMSVVITVIVYKDISSKEKSITDVSITDPIPILSRPSPLEDEAAQPPERKGTEAKSQSAIEIYRQIIINGFEYVFSAAYTNACKVVFSTLKSFSTSVLRA